MCDGGRVSFQQGFWRTDATATNASSAVFAEFYECDPGLCITKEDGSVECAPHHTG